MKQSYLSALQKGRDNVSVHVRVLRKWTVRENMGQGDPLYIGMVLVDTKGDLMYAEMSEEAMKDKAELVEIGNAYIISKFMVNYAKPTYKPFPAKFMISFTEFTSIVEMNVSNKTFPAYAYAITPFPKIVAVTGPAPVYTDVLGYLTKYTAVSSFQPKGKENISILREVFIKNMSDQELKITLWGELATSFNINDLYSEENPRAVIGLFVGCLPRKMYNDPGKVYLSGSTGCSYYFNPNIPEAEAFYKRFKDQQVYIERPPQEEEERHEEKTVVLFEHKTLAELNAIKDPYQLVVCVTNWLQLFPIPYYTILSSYQVPHYRYNYLSLTKLQEQNYKCTVTVTSIPQLNNWWYMSCDPCKIRIDSIPGGGYRCSRCKGSQAKPRYLLTFMASDDTAEATFFAHDDAAKLIVLKECEAVMNPLKTGIELPPQLQSLISKKFTFTISLTEDSFASSKKRKYLVQSILDRSDRKKSALNNPSTNEVQDVGSSSKTTEDEGSLTTPGLATTPPELAVANTYSKNISPQTPSTTSAVRKALLTDFNAAEEATEEEQISEDDASEDDDGPIITDTSAPKKRKRSQVGSRKQTKKKHVA